jgi:hypothetical protein
LALRNAIAMADFEITTRFLFNLWQRCYGHFCVLINGGKKFQMCKAFIAHLPIDKTRIKMMVNRKSMNKMALVNFKELSKDGT